VEDRFLVSTRIHVLTLCSIEEEKSRHAQTPAVATYPLLWLLFKPGTTVYTQVDKSPAACVVQSIDFTPKSSSAYHIKLWYLEFDGRRLGRRQCSRLLLPYDGEKEITSLDVYPFEYQDKVDDGAMRKRLENRGERYYKLLSGGQAYYSGESLGEQIRWVSHFPVIILIFAIRT
jgi:hypothetical protein